MEGGGEEGILRRKGEKNRGDRADSSRDLEAKKELAYRRREELSRGRERKKRFHSSVKRIGPASVLSLKERTSYAAVGGRGVTFL